MKLIFYGVIHIKFLFFKLIMYRQVGHRVFVETVNIAVEEAVHKEVGKGAPLEVDRAVLQEVEKEVPKAAEAEEAPKSCRK